MKEFKMTSGSKGSRRHSDEKAGRVAPPSGEDYRHEHARPYGYQPDWSVNAGYKSVQGARCSSMVRAFAHGAMGRRIDPSWGEPNELFLILASAPQLV